MTDGSGTSLLMGSIETNQPVKTLGEIQSNSGPGGNPANDFPAQSFFDIFAEMDMSIQSTPVQLTNTAPLIHIRRTPADSARCIPSAARAPPAVVPIYFANNVPAFGNAALKGDQFGTFTIQPYAYNYVVPEPSSVLVLGIGGSDCWVGGAKRNCLILRHGETPRSPGCTSGALCCAAPIAATKPAVVNCDIRLS